MRRFAPSLLALAAACAAPAALAADGGREWTLGLGVHQVAPKSDNGALAGGTLPVDVGSATRPTITAEVLLNGALGIEVLAALPFRHDISIDGLGKIGSTKHLPPVVSLQYHFNHAGKVSPFVGAGVNYTVFFDEEARGALAGSDLSLSGSFGAALHAGVDFRIGERGSLRVDARWIDIDTDVSLDGTDIGSVAIDPRVYGVAWVTRF